MYLLKWGMSGTWVEEEVLIESIFDVELEASIPESVCNTRKEKDKRAEGYWFYFFNTLS